jgi:hypothetical protein
MLIVVFNIGNLSYSEPAIEILSDYFNKYNLKYEIVTDVSKFNVKNAHPSWMKMLSYKMFPDNDFIFNWDLDLLPLNSTPNIEDYTDFSKLNMCYDSSVVLGYEVYNPKTFKYNGGLIGVPKSLGKWCENIYNQYAPGTYPSYEQYYLNDEICKDHIDVNRLPDKLNTLYPKQQDGWDLWNKSFIRHYSFGGFQNPPSMFETISKHREEYFT